MTANYGRKYITKNRRVKSYFSGLASEQNIACEKNRERFCRCRAQGFLYDVTESAPPNSRIP